MVEGGVYFVVGGGHVAYCQVGVEGVEKRKGEKSANRYVQQRDIRKFQFLLPISTRLIKSLGNRYDSPENVYGWTEWGGSF